MQAIGLLKDTVKDWSDDEAPRLGAALAYYTVFSLAPLLLIVIAVAGLVFGADAARGELVGGVERLLGRDGARMVEGMLAASAEKQGRGIVATVVGVAILLLGASGVFGQLQAALNKIWEVAPAKHAGILGFVKKRLLSMGMVLSMGFLLIVSLVVSTALTAAGGYLEGYLPGSVTLWKLVNNTASFLVLALFFAAIYKIMPDAQVRWRDVWIGALVTAALFVAGKFLIGLYLGRSTVTSQFGAASALVALLVWVYYAGQIFFLGAEFTQVWARRHGRTIEPEKGAQRVIERKETRDQGGGGRP